MISWIKKFTIITVLLMSTFLGTAQAQVQTNDIILSINPTNPTPNKNVTAVLNSYVIDLNKADISWSVNNKETLTGVGKKLFLLILEIWELF